MLKILWATLDRSERVVKHFDDFRDAVKKYADVDEIYQDTGRHIAGSFGQRCVQDKILPPLKIQEYLDTHPAPDLIICDALFAYLHEPWKNIKIPKAVMIVDVHGDIVKRSMDTAFEGQFDFVFHRFNTAFHKVHPEAKDRHCCIWLPHAIDTERFYARGSHKNRTKDVLHLGIVDEFYPNRQEAVFQLNGRPYFELIPRPKESMDREKKWPVGEDYAELIASAHICITGGSIYDAPVLKYFEFPACGTLLMSNWFSDLGLLGFVPGINMVVSDNNDLAGQIGDLLNDKSKIKNIAFKGMKLIHECHNLDLRARQFLNWLNQLILNEELFSLTDTFFQKTFWRPNND